MYLDNEDFICWMEKLSKRLNEIGNDLKSLVATKDILGDDDKILDNQDLCFLLKVSYRTLQRYHTKKQLPYFKINNRPYYRASDIRAFVQKYCDIHTMKHYEQQNKDKQ
ncbi:hypothetical protein GGR21_000725 [Dysgonomonas hofstadii]|uniref:Helix-turn-helix domain-containing protein n=1 Tax=Dysgonomonas hofstadii TaxID=637886 RepID=A0A840CLB4_9BACT|nr:helix-turn-helix domain-containing protein [Dysgonomonas hofstadii]MBB4034838.1 hypothetical protein [Dysgonomonas hofstadii]